VQSDNLFHSSAAAAAALSASCARKIGSDVRSTTLRRAISAHRPSKTGQDVEIEIEPLFATSSARWDPREEAAPLRHAGSVPPRR
jgi:hypothetical protein